MDPQERVSTATSVSISITTSNEEKPNPETLKLAENYVIPPAVKLRLDTDATQANAVAITTALFAGALLSLAQMVETDSNSSSAWEALRFFTYSAVILNLAGTFLCLAVIKMCSDVPYFAQQMVLSQPDSWPSRIVRGESLSQELLRDRWLLLKSFGMPWRYIQIELVWEFVVIFACIYSFVALTIWVWLTKSHAVAGATMVTMVPAFAGVVFAFGVAGNADGSYN